MSALEDSSRVRASGAQNSKCENWAHVSVTYQNLSKLLYRIELGYVYLRFKGIFDWLTEKKLDREKKLYTSGQEYP